MNRHLIAKVIQKLSHLKKVHLDFLEEVTKIKDPKKLVFDLQKHSNTYKMSSPEILNFIKEARDRNLFENQFKIPNMERGWRLWLSEHAISNVSFFR